MKHLMYDLVFTMQFMISLKLKRETNKFLLYVC